MSATSQVAAQLAQVARQLQGSGVGGDGGGGDDRPLDGGLPDNGVLVALADVATNRLYAVVEAEDGTLYLELSSALTSEEFMKSSVRDEAKLVFRRTVRPPAKRSLARDHRPNFFEQDATRPPHRATRVRRSGASVREETVYPCDGANIVASRPRTTPTPRHLARVHPETHREISRRCPMRRERGKRVARVRPLTLNFAPDPLRRVNSSVSNTHPPVAICSIDRGARASWCFTRQASASTNSSRRLTCATPTTARDSAPTNDRQRAPSRRDDSPACVSTSRCTNIAAATREPTPWQRNLASGGMTMAGAWRTPTLLPEAPLEALPEPPTSLGSSRANSRPPTAPHSRADRAGKSDGDAYSVSHDVREAEIVARGAVARRVRFRRAGHRARARSRASRSRCWFQTGRRRL